MKKITNPGMKILVIDNSRWWGGAEKNLYTLISTKNKKIRFIIVSDYPMPHNVFFKDFCVTKYRFQNPKLIEYLDSKTHNKAMRALRLIIKSLSLIPIILKERPDIVHFFLYRSSDLSDIVISKVLRKKIVLHIRSLASQIRISPLSVKLADAVACVSKSVLKGFGFVGEKFHIVYNGVEINQFHDIRTDEARKTLQLELEGFVIGSIGNIESRKGHGVAVKALKQLMDDGNQPVSLIIVGKDSTHGSTETQKIRDLCKNINIQDKVKIFAVSHDYIGYVYGACDVILSVSSDGEAFGMIPVEAALYNRPVIATSIGAYTETIIDRKTGLLCAPDSSEELAAAIETLMKNKNFYDQVTKCARKRISEKFSANLYRDKMFEIYKTVLEKNESLIMKRL